MDISEYDQYIPQKELDMNFRIPRRQGEDSSGTANYYGGFSVDYSQYNATAGTLSDYVGLSGAASRASAHSNYRGPVPYTDVSKINTSLKPPPMTTNPTTSIAAPQIPITAVSKPIEYPKPTTISGSSVNLKWDADFYRRPNQSSSINASALSAPALPALNNRFSAANQGQSTGWNSARSWTNSDLNKSEKRTDISHEPALPVPSSFNKFSGTNRSQGTGWNSGRGGDTNNAQDKWNKGQETQASKWYNPQGFQASKWNNTQGFRSKEEVMEAPRWRNTEAAKWNNSKEPEQDNTHDFCNPQPPKWDVGDDFETPKWGDSQGGNKLGRNQGNSDTQVADRGLFEWKRIDNRGGGNFGRNQGNPDTQVADRGLFEWKRIDNRGGGNFGRNQDNSGEREGNMDRFAWSRSGNSFNKNQEDSDRFGADERQSGWNRGGNNFNRNQEDSDGFGAKDRQSGWGRGGNNSNRGFRGRGGMSQRGFKNDQGKFGGRFGVLDNNDTADSSFGAASGWKPRNFQSNDGQKRLWNKSEKPKKPKVDTPPVVIADVTDDSLPKDLREMFQPLYCKLCSLQMTSNVMAKMHYVSKNHEKKIRKYLVEHSEKTGEPLHPRATLTGAQGKKDKEEDKDPKNFYCELCDLPLTGKQHADSHYMGKSHNAVRMGRKRPAGQGFYDASGKWIRKNKEAKLEYAEGEDTFGMDFKAKTEEDKADDATAVPKPQPTIKTLEQFSCSLCVVSCVSKEQLDVHLGGSKHKKKLKAKGISPDNFILREENLEGKDSPVVVPSADDNTDVSLKIKYITPNGYYYCEKCNLTVNSEIQFKQHLDSRNHAKKANALKTE